MKREFHYETEVGLKEEEEGMDFQISIDTKKCTGCGICELVCSLYNNMECNPEKSSIRVVRYEDDGILYSVPIVCQQCEKPLCQEVCPTGGISRDIRTNALVVNKDKCIGCNYCVCACPFGGISIDQEKGVATKCELCDGKPKCVDFCPTGALSFIRSDKIGISKKREGVDRYLENLKSVLCPLIEKRGEEI